jgi:hypothetical protein
MRGSFHAEPTNPSPPRSTGRSRSSARLDPFLPQGESVFPAVPSQAHGENIASLQKQSVLPRIGHSFLPSTRPAASTTAVALLAPSIYLHDGPLLFKYTRRSWHLTDCNMIPLSMERAPSSIVFKEGYALPHTPPHGGRPPRCDKFQLGYPTDRLASAKRSGLDVEIGM